MHVCSVLEYDRHCISVDGEREDRNVLELVYLAFSLSTPSSACTSVKWGQGYVYSIRTFCWF